MEGGKKIAVIVILLALIVGAIVFTAKKRSGAATAPSAVRGRPIEKIDSETGEIASMSWAEWNKQGGKDGLFKNPTTGEFTMDTITVDPETGEKVPHRQSTLYIEDQEKRADMEAAGEPIVER